jgi:serine/threonine protein kinase/tetratricopeptide (TPR) repeat protein
MSEREIFVAALAKSDPRARAAYLAQACGDDAALRRRVDSLVHEHEQLGSFLESPAASQASATTEEAPRSEEPGSVIGAYKLLEQIGEGGFGVVFMAQQQEPIRRKVALKVLKPGMDTRQVITRFEAERQALALMDHPNIAKVLDAGQTPSGRPYFVMDLVSGLSITDFCDQQQLTPRERLELFVSVCEAVQHAHHKGIIHRDLKPSNVMVTLLDGTPLVKVIDFGIAKALGQELTDKTLFTGFAQIIGTPLYMSPEQAAPNSVDVDTRSDIYSLGVVLYELLTGKTPFDKERLREVGLEEIRRIIREEEPPRPSTRVSTLGQAASTISSCRKSDPKRLSQVLRGELDWIVMKALDKDRKRRYETASAFVADVQRYLNDEPVQACPPSAGYRFRKFLLRNRRAVAVALATLAIGGLFVGLITWRELDRIAAENEQNLSEAARLREAHDKVEHQRQRADLNYGLSRDAVKRYFTTVSDNKLLKVPGMEGLRKELLSNARDFYEKFIKERQDDPSLDQDMADSYFRLGTITGQIGSKTEAIAYYAKALVLYRVLSKKENSQRDHRIFVAKALHNIGVLQRETGSRAQALTSFTDCIQLRLTLLKEQDEIGVRRELGDTYLGLGLLAEDGGQLEEAHDNYREARTNYLEAAKGPEASVIDVASLSSCDNNLGNVYLELGKVDDARRFHKAALDRLKPIVQKYPEDPDFVSELASSYRGLANVHRLAGRPGEAVDLLEEGMRLCESLAQQHPLVTSHRVNLASLGNNLGITLLDQRNLKRGAEVLTRTLELRQDLVSRHADTPDLRRDLAMSHLNLAQVLEEQGKLLKAEELLLKALDISTKLTKEFPDVREYNSCQTGCQNNLSKLYRALGQMKKAEEFQLAALQRRVELHDRYPNLIDLHRDLILSHLNLGVIYKQSGHATKGVDPLLEAIDLSKDLSKKAPNVPLYGSELASIYNNLSLAYLETRELEKAREALREALAIRMQLVKDHPDVPEHLRDLALSHSDLSQIHSATADLEKATAALEESVRLRKKLVEVWPEVHVYKSDLTGSYNNLANALGEMGDADRAEKLHLEALKIRKQLVADCPGEAEFERDVALSCNNLGMLYQRTGAMARAEKLFKEAAALGGKLVESCPDVPLYRSEWTGSRSNLAALYIVSDRADQAEKLLLELFRDRKKLVEYHPDVAEYRRDIGLTHGHLGETYKSLRKPVESEKHYKQEIEVYRALVKDYPESARYLSELTYGFNNLGNLYTELLRLDEAVRMYGDAMEIRKKLVAERPGVPEFRRDLAMTYVALGGVYRMGQQPKKAEPLLLKGLELHEKLAGDYSKVLTYQQDVAMACGDMGQFYRVNNQAQEAIKFYDRSIARLKELLAPDENRGEVRRFLVNAHWWKGETLYGLEKYEASLKELDLALETDRGQSRYGILAVRSCCLTHVGQYKKAAADAIEALARDDVPADTLYNFACGLALAMVASEKDDKLPPAERTKLQETWALKAMEALERCNKAGYFRNQNFYENLQQDPDLNPLRKREDFKRLLKEASGGR